MPMLKTAASGTTTIVNVKNYLEKERRQEHDLYAEELTLFEEGQLQLSERQVGQLKSYLEGNSRALAIDVSEDLTKRNWAREMDFTRARYRHDRPTKRGTPRTYYHFILSPSIDEDCDFETFRSYAKTWTEENFRSKERLYQYAIVYHDDNAKGVLHAHIIVNVTNKATGKKLHISNKEVVRLGNSAQDIGERFGFSPIRPDNEYKHVGVRTRQPIYMSRGERELLNKGQYSWKWELRKVISDIAPLSSDFDDFKLRMNQAGYDVKRGEKWLVDEDAGRDDKGCPIYKFGYSYLTYTHRNGKKVRDSKLGARFYPEMLERDFSHERVIQDRNYDSWELIKISKGQIPWKEDIRRAIDAVAPTVMSIPELEEVLRRQYGIQMIFNRRGVTYRHSSGYKTRDVGIGFRYTLEGLRQNAVVPGMTSSYPRHDAILEGSAKLTKHYLPRSAQGIEAGTHEKAAAHLIYRDLTDFMLRNGIARIDDINQSLENRFKSLREEKASLTDMRSEVMRWNHLAVLQARYERDRNFLKGEGKDAEPSLYNDVLIRSERLRLYLRKQARGENIRQHQGFLSKAYEERLCRYQDQLNELNGDRTVYQNYLLMGGTRLISEENEGQSPINVQALFDAGKTLSARHIKDFFHLSQCLSQGETKLDLANYRLEKAQTHMLKLERLQADIRAYQETKAYLPVSGALADRPASLGIESHQLRFKSALESLSSAGISEDDFERQDDLYRRAVREYHELLKERNETQSYVEELKEAQRVCRDIADVLKFPLERETDEGKKSGSSTYDGVTVSAEKQRRALQLDERLDEARQGVADLPIEEAKRRRQERMRQAPERSRSLMRDDLWR